MIRGEIPDERGHKFDIVILCRQLGYSIHAPHRRGRRRGACDCCNEAAQISEAQFAPSSAPRELTLIQRAIAGDAMAQEQLFKDHSAKLYRTAFGVLRNKEDAEMLCRTAGSACALT